MPPPASALAPVVARLCSRGTVARNAPSPGIDPGSAAGRCWSCRKGRVRPFRRCTRGNRHQLRTSANPDLAAFSRPNSCHPHSNPPDSHRPRSRAWEAACLNGDAPAAPRALRVVPDTGQIIHSLKQGVRSWIKLWSAEKAA
jgi:hypothetical protein